MSPLQILILLIFLTLSYLLHAEFFGTDVRAEAQVSRAEFSNFIYLCQGQRIPCLSSHSNVISQQLFGSLRCCGIFPMPNTLPSYVCLYVETATMSPKQNVSVVYVPWLE